MNNTVGTHVLVDLHGCPSKLLEHVEFISESMYEAAKKSKATIVGKFFKQFDPYGVSGVIIIGESHLSIHTWPEYNLASIDYFSCSKNIDIAAAIEHLKKVLQAENIDTVEVIRGTMRVNKIHNIPISEAPVNEMAF